MYDAGFYTDRYELWRPTETASTTGERTLKNPATATQSGQPCILLSGSGTLRRVREGLDVQYDAKMLVPASTDLKPKLKGEEPDVVHVTQAFGVTCSRWFRVLFVAEEHGEYLTVVMEAIPNVQ